MPTNAQMIEEILQINLIANVKFSETSQNKTSEINDRELVKAVLAGDESAFNVIFDRYKKLVVHLVGRFFNQHEMVEDISQQAFTKVYFSLKNFRGEQEKSLQSWISRVTVNVCYDELRRRKRQPENLFTELSNDESEYVENLVERASSDSEMQLINKDLAEKLLSGLDAKDRLALTLYHGQEFSVSEVAKLVGWTESNVKIRLFRTRKYLQNLLEKFS
jgi:RNA polymerase sigma factor (sigma-70 family)